MLHRLIEMMPKDILITELPIEIRLLGLSARERMHGLSCKERLNGLAYTEILSQVPVNQRFCDLDPADAILALPENILKQLELESVVGLSSELQHALQKKGLIKPRVSLRKGAW